jgi:outer membrane lipoprotein SlyB
MHPIPAQFRRDIARPRVLSLRAHKQPKDLPVIRCHRRGARPSGLALPCLLTLLLSGCGPSYSPNTYASNAVQQANKVDQGVVVGVRAVSVSAQGTTGAVMGGAAGAAAGTQVGGGGISTAFGAIGGTLIGGLVGTTVEHTTADTSAWEYVVRRPNGDLISVTQKDTTPLAIGQKVLVIAGAQARIVPDYTVQPPPPPADKPADAATDKPADGAKDKPADDTNDKPPASPIESAPLPAAPAPTGAAPAASPADPALPVPGVPKAAAPAGAALKLAPEPTPLDL